jgi:alpha-tubulin suppressor-like RCC1 family protein
VSFFREHNLKVVHVSCGRVHTVFLTDDGNLWTCGSGVHGRLGTLSLSLSPLLFDPRFAYLLVWWTPKVTETKKIK